MNWIKTARSHDLTFAALAATIIWFVPSAGQIDKWHSSSVLLGVCAAVFIAFLIGFRRVRKGEIFKSSHQSTVLFIGLWILVSASMAFLYPLYSKGLIGPPSDRGDALNVGVHAVLHAVYPYYAHTFQSNPLTPMPGALLLALPFYFLGNSSFQNIFWIGCFLWFTRRYFEKQFSALFCFLAFIFLNPGGMQEYSRGGDYLINAIYVCIAFYCVASSYLRQTPEKTRVLRIVFLAVTLCSRPIYAVMAMPILGALILQRTGKRSAITFYALSAFVAAVLVLPFYLYDPAHFTPFHIAESKLAGMPASMHFTVILPVVALITGSLSFFIKLDVKRIFGMATAVFAVIFLPFFLLNIALNGWTREVLYTGNFALPLTVFGGVWLVKIAEESTAQDYS